MGVINFRQIGTEQRRWGKVELEQIRSHSPFCLTECLHVEASNNYFSSSPNPFSLIETVPRNLCQAIIMVAICHLGA